MSSAITRLGEQSEARESTAPNSEATLYRTKLPLRRVKLENAPLRTTKLPLRRVKLENAPLQTTKLLSIERRLFAWKSLERKDTTGPKAEAAGLMS